MQTREKELPLPQKAGTSATQARLMLCAAILLAAFLLSLCAEGFAVFFQSLKGTGILLPDSTATSGAIEEQGETYLASAGDSTITFTMDGAYMRKAVLTVTGLSSNDAERNTNITLSDDDNTYFDSAGLCSSLEIFATNHAFTIPRTIQINSKPTQLTLSVSVPEGETASIQIAFTNKVAFNWFTVWMLTLLLFIGAHIALAVLRKQLIFPEVASVVIILLLGFVFAFFVPTKLTFDEHTHFTRSYNVGIGNLNYRLGQEIAYPKGIDELNLNADSWLYTNYDEWMTFQNYYADYKISDTETRVIDSQQVVYTPVPYLFSGLGVAVARLFDTSLLSAIHLAKFFNVLAYAMMAFFAIRLAPAKKMFFAAFFLLPVNILFAASLGGDFFINGMLALALSGILRCRFLNQRISLAGYVMLAIGLCLIPCAKSTYAPALLLLLLLRKENLPEKISPALNRIIGVLGMLLLFVLTYLYGNRDGISQWPIEGVDTSAQIAYILKNPLQYIKILCSAFAINIVTWLTQKYYLMAYMHNANTLLSLADIGVMLVLAIQSHKERRRLHFDRQDYAVLGCAVLGMYVLSYTALYVTFTPVGATAADGIQARYMIPMALLLYTVLMGTPRIRTSLGLKTKTVCLFGCTLYGLLSVFALMLQLLSL